MFRRYGFPSTDFSGFCVKKGLNKIDNSAGSMISNATLIFLFFLYAYVGRELGWYIPLLQTTGNCLAGQTFRSKITSYGDFRNGKVWASSSAWEAVRFNMAVNTSQHKGLNTLRAVETFRAPTTSASGVTSDMMDQ